MTFSPDGKTLASASWDGKLGLWDVASQRNLGLLRGHNGDVYCAAFSPDGRTIVTSGGDPTVRFWNVETRQEMFVLRGRKLESERTPAALGCLNLLYPAVGTQSSVTRFGPKRARRFPPTSPP